MRASCTLDSGTDTAPGRIELEFDAGRRQRIHDLAALALRELAVQHRVVLSLRPQDQPDGGGNGGGHSGEQADLLEAGNVGDAACG